MKTNLLKGVSALLVMAISAGAAMAAEPVYAFQQYSKGVIARPAPVVTPPPVVVVPPPVVAPPSKPSSTLGTLTLPTGKRVGDSSFVISAPSSNSSGAFTYSSSNPTVVNISGDVAFFVGQGVATITATQAASTDFIATTTSVAVTVGAPIPPGLSVCLDGSPSCAKWSDTDKMFNISIAGELMASTSGACAPSCPSHYGSVHATVGKSSGKYYWEIQSGPAANGWYIYPCGISPAGGSVSRAAGYDLAGGYGMLHFPAPGNSVYGCQLNLDNLTFSWTLNGMAQSTISIAPGTYYPSLSLYATDVYMANFGQAAFKYPVPAGYTAGVR
jgi:hypothetical protein